METMTMHMMTPDKTIFEGRVNRIRAYGGWEGYFTILPHHAPMVTSLRGGELQIEDANKQEFYIAIDAGIIEVVANHVNILSQVAVRAEERDVATNKMKAEQSARQKQHIKDREQAIRSEMELYRLLRETNDA